MRNSRSDSEAAACRSMLCAVKVIKPVLRGVCRRASGRRRSWAVGGFGTRLSGRVAGSLWLGKAEAEAAVNTVFQANGESLDGEKAVWMGEFSTFAMRNREARRLDSVAREWLRW